MPPFEVACDKNRDTVRDRLRQTHLHVFFCFFVFCFPVIIKFSEQLFRQFLLFEKPLIFHLPGGGGGGEGEQVQDSGGLRGFQGGTERISVVINRV